MNQSVSISPHTHENWVLSSPIRIAKKCCHKKWFKPLATRSRNAKKTSDGSDGCSANSLLRRPDDYLHALLCPTDSVVDTRPNHATTDILTSILTNQTDQSIISDRILARLEAKIPHILATNNKILKIFLSSEATNFNFTSAYSVIGSSI
jgi:hypothetical protein